MPFKILLPTGLFMAMFSMPMALADDDDGNNSEKLAVQKPAENKENPLLVIDYTYKTKPEKSFKMQVPSDWEVKEDFMGYEVYMEPKEKAVPTQSMPIVADPNISVKVLSKPMPIDSQSLEEYAAEIITKFNDTNGASSEFQVFQKVVQDITPEKKVLLYDCTFKKNGFDAFQTILVLSSADKLYRVTLTDYKAFFESRREKFFPVLASIELPSQAPTRTSLVVLVGPWAAGILGILVLFIVMGRIRARKQRALWEDNSEVIESTVIKKNPVSHNPVGSLDGAPAGGGDTGSSYNTGTFVGSIAPGSQTDGMDPHSQTSGGFDMEDTKTLSHQKEEKKGTEDKKPSKPPFSQF